jgi:hypothetical protein
MCAVRLNCSRVAAAAPRGSFRKSCGIAASLEISPSAHWHTSVLDGRIALAGDKAKAHTAYQDFFALWKDADPDIPILKEAKAEYAKLQ